jgi:hypothetical protein
MTEKGKLKNVLVFGFHHHVETSLTITTRP